MKLMPLTADQLAKYELRATMAERERCAKVAERFATEIDIDGEIYIARKIADAIRNQN